MGHRGRFVFLGIACVLLLAGCGGEHASLVSAAAPASSAALARLSAAAKDCLQYKVETRADGTEVWNADYVYFYLLDANSPTAWKGPDGKPVAQGLLASQAIEFMSRNPGLERRTDWGMRLSRQVQEVNGGNVTNLPGVTWLDDFDLEELLAKDAAARSR